MNYNYIDNNGRPAPSSIVWGGRRIANPSEAQLLAAGYHKREVSQASAPIDDTQARIDALKAELQATDYIALKAIEGYDCDSIYPDWKARRRALRDEINALESEV